MIVSQSASGLLVSPPSPCPASSSGNSHAAPFLPWLDLGNPTRHPYEGLHNDLRGLLQVQGRPHRHAVDGVVHEEEDRQQQSHRHAVTEGVTHEGGQSQQSHRHADEGVAHEGNLRQSHRHATEGAAHGGNQRQSHRHATEAHGSSQTQARHDERDGQLHHQSSSAEVGPQPPHDQRGSGQQLPSAAASSRGPPQLPSAAASSQSRGGITLFVSSHAVMRFTLNSIFR